LFSVLFCDAFNCFFFISIYVHTCVCMYISLEENCFVEECGHGKF
jgi:hypothetical protein